MACSEQNLTPANEANLANRNRGDGCDDCPDCCPHCESWTIGCPECCRCLPRKLCFVFTPYDYELSPVRWGMDYVADGSYGMVSVSCGALGEISEYADNSSTVEAVVEDVDGECQWRFTVDEYLNHTVPLKEAGCMIDVLEFEEVVIGNCVGVLQVTTEKRLAMPVEQRDYENCWSNWCDVPGGDCRCLCGGICVSLSGGDCLSASVVVSQPDGKVPPWQWSGELRCSEFQDVEDYGIDLPFLFEIGRNDDYECVASLSIANQVLEQVITGKCSELSVTFEVYLNEGDYEPVTIRVSCAECGACLGPDICCFRTLPNVLHLTYETANELSQSGLPSGGETYSTELTYQEDTRIWLGWKENGAGESCIQSETVARFRYHLRFEFQCDLAAEKFIVIRVFAAPAYNPITDETIPMPDPFNVDLWDSGADGECTACGVFADSGFTPVGSVPFQPSTETLSLCDPFIWHVNVPESLRSDQFGAGERLVCTCAGANWGPGAGKRYIVYFWSFMVTE